jgi:hypothetical protein
VLPFLLQAKLPQQDTLAMQRDTAVVKPGAVITVAIDSVQVEKDSISSSAVSAYNALIQRALNESRFLNVSGLPAAAVSKERPVSSATRIFYVLLAVVLLLGCLRFFYTRYFNNLFRVFFNTSLRQSQLTDQLLQAKQVSLFFNVLFAATGGLYIYFLLVHFNWIASARPLMVIGLCILTLAVIYFLKYIVLKFTGWITGYKEAANTYLFIIFLINKILSVLLIPFVIVIAFGAPFLQYPAVLVSLLLTGLIFLLRFLRSYGLLQNQVKVSRMHFFMYIIGVELVPLLLIYKALMVLLNKKL